MSYILVDTSNLFARAKFAVQGPIDIKLGMSLHIMFNGVKKAWDDFNGSHIIFCFDGKSWRKEFYKPYKANRAATRAAMTEKEREEEELFWEVFEDFKTFVTEQTNCSVFQHKQLEADDLIAGFIQHHPNDNHVIISTDTDFYQLIAPNVKHYNGVSGVLTTIEGKFDNNNAPLIDNKTGQPFPAPDPEWLLFEKCIRGDTSDNVFSAYPGVRTKGSKKKVGLLEAFADRETKGWAWNNIMLSKWTDHNQIEHTVADDYERNRILIDLAAQPDEIRKIIDETIKTGTETAKNVSQVGVRLLKFCGKHDLRKISESATYYAPALQARYLA
jgi:5'-3' exonuclease